MMFILATIGFVLLCIIALYMTFATGALVFSETYFSGLSPLSFVFIGVTIGLWALAYWLAPFSINVSVTA